MTRRRSSLLIVLTLVAALFLAACGAGSGTSGDPYASFLAGIDAVEQAGSSRIALDSATTLEDGTSFAVTGDGVGTFDGSRAELTANTEVPGMGIPLKVTTRVIDGVIYLTGDLFTQMLGEETWIEFTPEDAQAMSGFDLSSMLEQQQASQSTLAQLRGLVEDTFERVGEENVNGVAATHWTGTVTRDAALAAIADSANADVAAALESLPESYPVDVWLDEQNRPVRVRTSIDLTFEGQTVNNVTTIDLSDFGVEVNVEAPAETTSFSELQERLGGLGGFGG